MTTTFAEYSKLMAQRAAIISENKARRLRSGPKQPPLPVPPKPARPMVPVAYDAEGGYVGRLNSVDECPEGCVVKFEPGQY